MSPMSGPRSPLMIRNGTDAPNSSSSGPAWMPNAPISVALMMLSIEYVLVPASSLSRPRPQSSEPSPNDSSLSPRTCDAFTVR
jgi:hypothetical protein